MRHLSSVQDTIQSKEPKQQNIYNKKRKIEYNDNYTVNSLSQDM